MSPLHFSSEPVCVCLLPHWIFHVLSGFRFARPAPARLVFSKWMVSGGNPVSDTGLCHDIWAKFPAIWLAFTTLCGLGKKQCCSGAVSAKTWLSPCNWVSPLPLGHPTKTWHIPFLRNSWDLSSVFCAQTYFVPPRVAQNYLTKPTVCQTC